MLHEKLSKIAHFFSDIWDFIYHNLMSVAGFFYSLTLFLVAKIISLYTKEEEIISYFLILICIDIILGLYSSLKNKRAIRSSIAQQGIFFKFFMLFIVSFIALILKYYAQIDILKYLVIIGSLSEFLSIKEHIEDIFKIDILKEVVKNIKKYILFKKDFKSIIDESKDLFDSQKDNNNNTK